MNPQAITDTLNALQALVANGHLRVTQASLAAFIAQLAALIVGFGVVSNQTVGVVSNAAIAVVNVAFLIAAAVSERTHHQTAQHHASTTAAVAPPQPPK